MATVTVEINGRPYNVGCADGQEDRVRALARQFDDNVRQVAQDVGHVGDIRLFLMAALLVADELSDIRAQFNRLRGEHDRLLVAVEGAEKRAAEAVNGAAERIEKLLAE